MRALRYVLLGDGGRDAALLPVIHWTLRDAMPEIAVEEPIFRKRRGAIDTAMSEAIDRYGPDILFVHRDSERVPLAARRAEIPDAGGRIVRVVPVRMTEAWLLTDEAAIRRAAGNPNGRQPLDLPRLERLEDVPDPKRLLAAALLAASGFSGGRRRKQFQRDEAAGAGRVASFVASFAELRRLSAFRAFEDELRVHLADWSGSLEGRV